MLHWVGVTAVRQLETLLCFALLCVCVCVCGRARVHLHVEYGVIYYIIDIITRLHCNNSQVTEFLWVFYSYIKQFRYIILKGNYFKQMLLAELVVGN